MKKLFRIIISTIVLTAILAHTVIFALSETVGATNKQKAITVLLNSGWTEELRPLLWYGIERYWLQAVSDYDLISRVKMIIGACLLIHQLGGDSVATAQLYSKEIENSAENVDAILDAAYADVAFADNKLLGWLLL